MATAFIAIKRTFYSFSKPRGAMLPITGSNSYAPRDELLIPRGRRQYFRPIAASMEEALGYYRYPTITDDLIAFVCEDSIWTVPAAGGDARRLTGGTGESAYPRLSPDGNHIAYVGRDEGSPEVYVLPSAGGETKRLTFVGAEQCFVSGWTPDGAEILFTSDFQSPFVKGTLAYSVRVDGGEPKPLNVGHAASVSIALR